MDLFDIIFGGNNSKKTEDENKRLKEELAAERAKKAKTSPNAGKTKYVTKQCKMCGRRITYNATGIPPGGVCPRRGKDQPHIWQTLGYQYK